MTISFDEIPYDWLKPGTYVEAKAIYDQAGAVPYPARTLLVVQQTGGIALPLTIHRITRPEQGTTLFGTGSVGEDMVAAYKKVNRTSDVYAIGVPDDATGIAAVGTYTFAGTATTAGPLPLYVGNERIKLAVASGATAAVVATAAAAAINAVTTLPVTAAANTGVVTLTSRHKGEVGNGYSLKVAMREGDSIPTGLTATIAAMSGGANNPDITDVLDVIAAQWWTDIVVPWDDATTLAALAEDFALRFQAMGKKDAHGYVGSRGTFGQLTTKGALTNSPHLSIIGTQGSASPPWVWAASAAGLSAFQLANDPARQLRGLTLTGVAAPAEADQFSDAEQDLLLKGGISTFNTLTDGTVTIDRLVTTYKATSLGVADRAWLDIMVPKTLSRIRYDWAAYVTTLYPRSKLSDDDSIAAQADQSGVVVTPRRMQGTWGARCRKYEEWGWIEGTTETTALSVFERDAQGDRNRLNARQPIRIIGNLIVLAGSLEFLA
ncbi:phage tail sheath subtilisin-like domain-containing protein [Azorhizobium doebereinerae]|uniref:phage tail sheath subtilisin-like domain-containing protein n=1 Tax=Azorhizobium doebereinerae TaxID=281091 RepID=UPI0004175D00|nr:phage tail sheath subtilisin-like domain-containing protein [Azorhizobium doebereinerae]